MNMKKLFSVAAVCLSISSPSFAALSPKEDLGKQLFFDINLSEPAGQSCSSCHDPRFGFAEPDQNLPVSEGVIPGRFGTRSSPPAAYASFAPLFTRSGGVQGGQFWDGRAKDLIAQAQGPFLNPVEMNNTSEAQVVEKVRISAYASLFEQVYGASIWNDTHAAYVAIADAIAAYEGTSELNKFSSKFDAYMAGSVQLTAQEELGRQLFGGAAKCGHCHDDSGSRTVPALFTDFKYHNIGLPKNTVYPFNLLSPTFVDIGLGETTKDARDNGKFKTPHLRNIALTGPYMHNGVLTTLKEVVHFYNTRDIPGTWPAPEYPATVSGSFLGDLGLTDAEEDALVAFMMTFTDGYTP